MTVIIENIAALATPAILKMNESQVNGVLANVMKGARDNWQTQAKTLMTTRRAYMKGIQKPVVKQGYGYITLVGVLPHIVEEDQPLMRMHSTLLGPNVPVVPMGQRGAHVNKQGKKFRSIPFRHQTPGSIGQGGGAPIGHAYRGTDTIKNVRKMAKQVYGKAKKVTPTYTTPTGAVQHPGPHGQMLAGWGGGLQEGLAPILRPEADILVDEHGNEVLREEHAVDIYAGMVKMRKTYELDTQSHYMTFRTISEAKPNKWIRPPTQGRYFAKNVHDYVQRVTPAAFEAFVAGLK